MSGIIHIMLVEDDDVDIEIVKRAFEKNKIQNPLHIARNGEEALRMLRGSESERIPFPKIVLLDLNMPKMSGLEFLKIVREDEALKKLNIFIMTTSSEESDKIKAYHFNVAGYILKPLQFDKFVSAVSVLNSYWKLCE